jgi:hypothetical protein
MHNSGKNIGEKFAIIFKKFQSTVNPEIEAPGLLFSNPLNPKIILFFLLISKSKTKKS